METHRTKLSALELSIAAVVLIGVSFAVAPRFSRAAEESKLTQLSDTLHLVRCTLDLYSAQHEGLYPGQTKAGDAVHSGEFVRALTVPDEFGREPYFKTFPSNPFMAMPDQANTITCVNCPKALPDGTEGTAWWFNAATGDFRACDRKFHTAY